MAHLPTGTKKLARALRSQPTDAERALWRMLRSRQLDGWRFRRQHPVPPFVLDFACVEAKIAVEADGGQHCDSRHDAHRDRVLRGLGLRLLRFWNPDILTNPEGVAETIRTALAEAASPVPLPNPPPSATGEGIGDVPP
ncbi:MAG TPA: DUF559 domain-containing protein [Azospirillum sp.]|nr:DUF559 domain-containing protein [Azospirillum sp.]